MFQIIL